MLFFDDIVLYVEGDLKIVECELKDVCAFKKECEEVGGTLKKETCDIYKKKMDELSEGYDYLKDINIEEA
jgi:hypothetical protein